MPKPRTPKIHPLKLDAEVGKSMATLASAAALDLEDRRPVGRPNTASSRRNDPYAFVPTDSVEGTKRHWLWLAFADANLEKEFVKFAFVRERTSMMVANVILLFIASIMIVVTCRLSSSSVPNLTSFTTHIVPQILLIFIHVTSLISATLRRITTSQIASFMFIVHASAFYPLWTFAWDNTAVGPSVQLAVLQSMALMLFPTPIWVSFGAAVGGAGILIVGYVVIQVVATPGMDIDMRYIWGSSFVTYCLALSSGWLYARARQRALRRLFLLSRRRAAIQVALDLMGIDCDIDSWLTPIPMNRPDIENAIKRAEFTKQREGHRSSRPGTATVRPVSSGRRSRPQTAKSLAGEEKADVENLGRAASRPATAAGRVVVAIGNAYGDARDKAKMANTQPLNRKALQPDVPDEQLNPVFAIFLGQEPWPPSGERKYLRCQAQLHSVHAMYVLLRLAVASLITSLLDHFDRIRKEGATVSFDILTHRLLIQLLPSIGIPLVSIIILALLRHLRLLTWIQPLLLLTFSATASAFLLGPMEILSTITPDAFPQPKISAYVALIVILCAQSCLIVARSFVAWCLAILFLAIGRIPLALSWGGIDTSMPYYTAVQMVFLLIAMAAQVRAFEALSREAYETMHAVRLGDKALVAGTGRVRKLLKRKGEDDSFFGGNDNNEGVRDEFVEEFGSKGMKKGRKVVNSRHEVIEVEPFTVQPDEESTDDSESWEESDDDSYDMGSIYNLYDYPPEETDDVEEIVVTDTSGNSRMVAALRNSFEALEAMIAEMTAPRETRSVTTPIPQRYQVASSGDGKTMEKLQALLADESWRKEWVEDGESVQTSDAQQEKPVEHDEVRENTEYMVERHKLSSLSSSIRNLGIAETSRVGNSVMTASLHSINPVQPVTSKDEPSRAIGSTLEKLDISPHLDIKPSDVKEPGHPVHVPEGTSDTHMPELEQTNFEAIERTIAEPVGDMNVYERIDPLENLTRVEAQNNEETSEEGARMLVKHGKLAASVSLQHFFTEIPNEPVVDPIVEANVLSFETASEVKAKEEQGEKAEETAAIAEILAEVIPKPLTAEEKEEFGSRHVLESKQSVVTIGGKEIAELGTQPMRPSVPLAPVHVPLTSTKSVKSQDALEPTPAPSEIVEPQPGNTITPEESVTRTEKPEVKKKWSITDPPPQIPRSASEATEPPILPKPDPKPLQTSASSDVLSGSSSGILHHVSRGTRLPLVGDEKDLFDEAKETSSGSLRGTSHPVSNSSTRRHSKKPPKDIDDVLEAPPPLSPSVFSSTASIHPWMGGNAMAMDEPKVLPANPLGPGALGSVAPGTRRLQPLGSIRGTMGKKEAGSKHEGMDSVPEDRVEKVGEEKSVM